MHPYLSWFTAAQVSATASTPLRPALLVGGTRATFVRACVRRCPPPSSSKGEVAVRSALVLPPALVWAPASAQCPYLCWAGEAKSPL